MMINATAIILSTVINLHHLLLAPHLNIFSSEPPPLNLPNATIYLLSMLVVQLDLVQYIQ